MKKIQFYKYQGTGNDFILIDNRDKSITLSTRQVGQMCDRKFGIGADGLMLLEMEEGYDFKMVYYNSDGNESSMCGNGGRCITMFAHKLGVIENEANFLAIDGPHHATVAGDGTVSLQMQNVSGIEKKGDDMLLNTGSPHYVTWVDDVASQDVYKRGKEIRQRAEYMPSGVNVNFVQLGGDGIKVRTYERGVENETLSCGTGVTACAIATAKEIGKQTVYIDTPGGRLTVSFDKNSADTAVDVILAGPATYVFDGSIEV